MESTNKDKIDYKYGNCKFCGKEIKTFREALDHLDECKYMNN